MKSLSAKSVSNDGDDDERMEELQMMPQKSSRTNHWKERQAVMAVALSLATYLYNSFLNGPGSLLISNRSGRDEPVLSISTGVIRGRYGVSREGREYAEFLGIPFAQPPLNDLRFEDPVPVEPWGGVRDTKKYAPECMQIEAMVTGRVQGDEDCLYLNVFSPKLTSNRADDGLLPVMVFFHGGLFISGGAQMYRPKYFMDEDVVLVVPQYRLGALGFLNTGDGVVTGNMGLKDQNLALQWIQQNIKAFGGDPGKVTLFGNSAGGSSVHFHMLSPYSKGLFHKGISESGTAIKIWTLSKFPKEQSKKFASKLGCDAESTQEMVDCLKKLDGPSLVKPHIDTMSPIRDNTDLFVPSVDGDFIPDEPMRMIKHGNFSPVPWLLGVNAGEGLLNTGRILASESIYKNLGKMWNEWMPLMLDYNSSETKVSDKVRKYYFGSFKGKYLAEDVERITQVYSDRVYFHATHKAASYHSLHAPTYLYYYSYPGEYSFFSLFKAVMPRPEDIIPPELKIAADVAKDIFQKYVMMKNSGNPYTAPCHADELLLLFNMHRAVEIAKGSKDYSTSRLLIKAWTGFSKAADSNDFKYYGVSWPKFNGTSTEPVKYMQIDKRWKVIDEPFSNAVKFWDSLGV